MNGTIRERSPGHYELRVFNAPKDAQETKTYISKPRSAAMKAENRWPRDVQTALAAHVTDVASGKYGGTKATFSFLLDEWLAHGERLGRSPTTLHGYKWKVEQSIRPALGSKKLAKLTAHDLDKFYAKCLESGMGDRTVLHLHRIIAAALHQARKWKWVPSNVSEDATAPTPRKVEMKVPSPEQVVALINEAGRPSARNPEMATIIILAALTGMRRGELCGLRWSDIDWDNNALMIRRSIWQTSDGVGTKDPKSHQVRRLVLGVNAMGVLKGRLTRAQADAEATSVPLSSDGYIFSHDPDGARPIQPDSITQAFSRLCTRMVTLAKEADPPRAEVWPFHFHSLRHYAATELFAAGLNPKTVADRLGHADASITLRVYTANTDAQAQEAADSLESGLAMALPAASY